MARTAVAVQVMARTGITPTFGAPHVDGNMFPNDGRTFLEVKNASGAPINVTIQTPGTVDGLAVADQVVAVPATTGDKLIGPFPTNIYNQADEQVYVDFSAVASVTIAVVRL